MDKYYYGMRLRGFSIGCQPMRGLIGHEKSKTMKYYDIICYNRKLSEMECKDFDLDYLPHYKTLN